MPDIENVIEMTGSCASAKQGCSEQTRKCRQSCRRKSYTTANAKQRSVAKTD